MYIFSMKFCFIFPILFVLGAGSALCPCMPGGGETGSGRNAGGGETGSGGNAGGQETGSGGNAVGRGPGAGNGGGNSIEMTTAVATPGPGEPEKASPDQGLLPKKCQYTLFQKGQDPCGLRKYAQVCHAKGPCVLNSDIDYLPVIGNPYYFVHCGSARISHCQLCAPGTIWNQKELTCIK